MYQVKGVKQSDQMFFVFFLRIIVETLNTLDRDVGIPEGEA